MLNHPSGSRCECLHQTLADCKCRACFACAAKEFKGGEQKRSPVSSTQSPSPMWARPLLCSACHSEYLSCISPRSRLTVKWRSNLWLPLLRSLSCSQACKNSNNNLSHFSLLYHPIGERARSILQGLHVHLSVSITYRGSLTLSESDEVYRHLIHCRNTLPRLDTTSGKAFINTRPMVFIYHRPIANEREERKTTPCVSSGSILEGPGRFHGASTDAHGFFTQVSSSWGSPVSSIRSDPTSHCALKIVCTGQSYKDSLSTLCYPETLVIKLLAASQLMLEINFCQLD